MKRLIPTLLALALLAAACGADTAGDQDTTTTTPPDTTTTTPPTEVPRGDTDGVLLQVGYEGGFAPIEFVVNRIPAFTLFTDGTLLLEGPVAAIFPGPALPNIQQTRLDEQTLADIIELIDIIGLPNMTEVRNNDAANFVADATDTVVRYFDGNGTHLFSVYALGIGEGPGGQNNPVPDEVLNLGVLIDTLSRAGFAVPTEPYVPTALQLVLLSDDQVFVDAEFANTIDWPFGDLAIADFESNGFLSCTTLEGDAVAAALEALGGANGTTLYALDGAEHRILARPLLPGEAPCSMLNA